jgi:hypothetical protein
MDRDVSYLDYDRDDGRPVPTGPFTCRACGEECSVSWQDTGIGAYEYWGAKGVDVRMELLSECCGSEVTE